MLFLSYAEDGADAARGVLALLGGQPVCQGHHVAGDEQPIERTEKEISGADQFVALLTPGYSQSALCRWQCELAWRREQVLQASNPAGRFFHALLLEGTQLPDSLRDRGALEWPDNADQRRTTLGQISMPAGNDNAGGTTPGTVIPARRGPWLFRNRTDALDEIAHGLTNSGGPHFWLVIAPPQLGKSWLVDRLGATLALETHPAWNVKLVDLKHEPGLRDDVWALLRRFFGPEAQAPVQNAVADQDELDVFTKIAIKIVRSRKPLLCVLDSADLLPERSARQLRNYLSTIYHQVAKARARGVRLGVVVASRCDDGWRGLTPIPRVSVMKLREFTPEVVAEALRDLADDMELDLEKTPIADATEHVCAFSEGLPALLTRCLDWIRAEYWFNLERLDSQERFVELAHPYIQDCLLSQSSLAPRSEGQLEPISLGPPGAHKNALTHAFRLLAPYRLFTKSHLRYHKDTDQDLRDSLADLGWELTDLWRAINGAALVQRPLDELWQAFPPPIRRLLFRYFYPERLAQQIAHRNAISFMKEWAAELLGKEQAVGVIECLWLHAAELQIADPEQLTTVLTNSARMLSTELKESTAYSQQELRDYVARILMENVEFKNAVDDDDLFAKIIDVVREPEQVA